jgi:GxxExxY protein
MVDDELNNIATQALDAAFEVHRILGAGFIESVYQKAMAIELRQRKITFQQQHPLHLIYKQVPVGNALLDFLVAERLVLEIKAVEDIRPVHHAQVMNYLNATKLELGILINFNVPLLKDGIKRIILTQ